MTLDEIFAELRSKKNFRQGVPATDAEIAAIESALGTVLSDSYRTFIKQFGYCRWFGRSVYGVFEPRAGAAVPKDFDTTRVTVRARQENLPPEIAPLPRNGNVLERYDAGGYYFLFSQASSDSGAVGLIDHAQGGTVVQTWATFQDYLQWLLTL